MSKYGWLITKDYLYPEKEKGVYSGPGVVGPGDLSDKMKVELERGMTTSAFAMYDDDGEIYYRGRIVGDYDGFEPLDDYGTPNAGCTEIRYRNKETGKWETL